jgi:hypothetical protein
VKFRFLATQQVRIVRIHTDWSRGTELTSADKQFLRRRLVDEMYIAESVHNFCEPSIRSRMDCFSHRHISDAIKQRCDVNNYEKVLLRKRCFVCQCSDSLRVSILGEMPSHLVDDVNGSEIIRCITASITMFGVLVSDSQHTRFGRR